MNERGNKIIDSAKNIRMSSEERDRIKHVLMTEMEKTGEASAVINERDVRQEKLGEDIRPIYGGSIIINSLQALIHKKYMKIAIITALIAGLGGGTSVAAEGSLPGDPLYPVKIHVNERVAGAFHIGAEARASREARLVEKRLEEMNKIAVRADVDSRARLRAEDRLDHHIEELRRRAANLEARGNVAAAAEVMSRAEASLSAGTETVAEMRDRSQVAIDMDEAMRARLQAATEARAEVEERVTASADVEVSARRAYRAALNSISESENFISRLGRGFEVLAMGARERLDIASDLVVEGEAHLEAGEYREAYIAFSDALRTSQSVKFALENHLSVGIQSSRPADTETRPRPEAEDETRPTRPEEEDRPTRPEEGSERPEEERPTRPLIESEVEADIEAEVGETEAEGEAGFQLSL